jgi:hypothetical protein
VEIWIDGTHVGGHIGRRWRELEAIGRLSDAWFGSFRSATETGAGLIHPHRAMLRNGGTES